MKYSMKELDEIIRTQKLQVVRMNKENVARANELLLRMLTDAARNKPVRTQIGSRTQS